jgi:hypothetical protein
MAQLSLPENFKIVSLYGGPSDGSITTMSDWISCKNAQKVWIVGYYYGTTATTFPVTMYEATAVAGTGSAIITATWPIWKVSSTTSTDALTRQTDAAILTIDPDGVGTSPMLFVFEWDPSKFSAGFDCLAVKGLTGNAADNVSILAYIQERYGQAAPPSAIVD